VLEYAKNILGYVFAYFDLNVSRIRFSQQDSAHASWRSVGAGNFKCIRACATVVRFFSITLCMHPKESMSDIHVQVSLATDSDSHVSKTDQNKTVRQMMREMTAHSRIPELHSNDADQEIVVGLSTVKMLPKGEIMNDWDRDVYGVDEFSEEILDDFETSMGALMHEEFSATKASVLKDTNSVQGATGDHPCVESITDDLD